VLCLFLAFEQLEIDPPEGSLKRVEMRSEPGHEIEVALPDEFKGDRSGPLFFPHVQDEEQFKKKFADARVLPLSSSSFTSANGVHHLQMARTGIPTGSYYTLSLPAYAVPSEITVRDPRSAKTLDKYVVRDDKRKRFVIYIECQSPHGAFDFLLDITFTIQRRPGIFDHSEYTDEHVRRYSREIVSEKTATSPEQIELAARLLADKANQTEGMTSELLMVNKTAHADRLSGRLRKGKRCAQVIDEMKRIKRMYDHEGFTSTEIEERHKDFEVWAIVKNRLDAEGQQHFRSPGTWERELVPYALSILSKEYDDKAVPSTIYDWVKDYRRHSKTKK
jgi:hypothetical protein